MRGDGPVASICLHYILSAMPLDAVVKKYLKPLKRTAKEIESALNTDEPAIRETI